MCGIVGFVDKKGYYSHVEKLDLIRKMREKIAHRGSDSYGEYIDKNIALGHARLSILDTSKRGYQPMINKNENIIITFNGEIYNHNSIRQNIKDVDFKTKTDTETILAAYQEWGTKCLKNFNGMWAFAILDRTKQELFLSIDRFGIKPIYYINNKNFFAFASEIKALLILPGVKAKLNTSTLPEYLLFRSIAGRETMFKDIHKFLPAETLVCNLNTNRINIKRYWKLIKKRSTHQNPQGELLQRFRYSVKKHLLSDVPIGIQLSGGVDSSLVAALATSTNKKTRKKIRLHSFSIGLPDAEHNEFYYSRIVAKKIKSIHHEIIFTEKDFCKLLPMLTYNMDEPISHEHSIPMYILSKYARTRVKALLSGEGADETFGGYRRYETFLTKTKFTAKELVDLASFGNETIIKKVFKTNFLSLTHARKNRIQLISSMSRAWNNFDKISALDIETYLTPLLVRQDKMGMAATLENRVPFLDHDLVEFSFSLPTKYKIQNSIDPWKHTKPLLKKVASKLLPYNAVYRKKVGFGLPLADWLRNENGLGKYLNLILSSKRTFYNKSEIVQMIQNNRSGKKDYTQTLWILLNLELWARIFIDKENHSIIWNSLNKN